LSGCNRPIRIGRCRIDLISGALSAIIFVPGWRRARRCVIRTAYRATKIFRRGGAATLQHCDIRSEAFSPRRRSMSQRGRPWRTDMAADIVDTELWLIIAAMVGWIFLGCMMTRGLHGPARPRRGFDLERR
jgi:hypothetical protein